MNALYATLRLVWRPATLVWLTLTGAIVSALLQIVADVSETIPVLRALWDGTATQAMVSALWVVLVVAPACVGFIVAANRLDLQHTTLSWHLPDLRRRLLVGTIVCGLMVASALAAVVSRNTPSFGTTAAAFSIAFCAFVTPGFVHDAAVPRPLVLAGLLFLATAAIRPGSTARLAHDFPMLVAALAGGFAAVQLHAIVSSRTARMRPLRGSLLRQSGSHKLYRMGHGTRRGDWRQSLATTRLLTWVRAAAYESNARFPLDHLGYAAAGVVLARLMDFPQAIPFFAGSFLFKTGLQLRMQPPYPLSRSSRAAVAYMGSVVEAVTYFLFLGLLLYATALVPLPELPISGAPQSRPGMWLLVWGCSFALAPVAQWRRIRRPHENLQRPTGARHLVIGAWLFGYALLVGFAAGQINVATRSAGNLDSALIAIGVLLLVAQAIHATLVFAHFAIADLARSPD